MPRLIVTAFLVLLAACSGGSDAPAAGASTAAPTSLPATVEGLLVIDVEEGDVGEDGASDVNFGSLTVGDEELMVEISGSLLSGTRIPGEGAQVRAILGSKSEQFGVTSYKITQLTRL